MAKSKGRKAKTETETHDETTTTTQEDTLSMTEDSKLVAATIAGVTFHFPERYAAGATELTEGEAAALNQTQRENVRNNQAKVVKEVLTKHGVETLDENHEAYAELSAAVNQYYAEYQFSAGSVSRASSSDPLDKEILRIATARVTELVRTTKQMTVKAYKAIEGNEEKFNAAVTVAMNDDQVIADAREALEKRKQRAETGLAGLEL